MPGWGGGEGYAISITIPLSDKLHLNKRTYIIVKDIYM